MELITTDKNGKQWSREIKEGETVKLYGDEVEIQVVKPKRKKKK